MFIQSQWDTNLWLYKKMHNGQILILPKEIIEINEDVMYMEGIYHFVKTHWLKICEDQNMSRFELMEI